VACNADRALVIALMMLPALGACAGSFSDPSLVNSVRALSVRSSPASGSPGAAIRLELLAVDGSAPPGSRRPLQVAWLGGCHNPRSGQFFNCYSILREIAKGLDERVVTSPETRFPPGVFAGMTSTEGAPPPEFDFTVPEDILTASPRSETEPVHAGVSYVFFAVCAGELHPRLDLTDRVPLGCRDPDSGAELGTRDFVTGFTTIHSYEGVQNQTPLLRDVLFGQMSTSVACSQGSDCAGAPDSRFAATCGPAGLCIPRLKVCSAKKCPKFAVQPVVDPVSAEALPGQAGSEVIWANFFATAGDFKSESQLVNDRTTGLVADDFSDYAAPRTPVGLVDVWVTVNDQRGGDTWQALQVLVEQ
jgi:hypothetical protein